ncbi:MAG: cobalamin biosynthesis protein CobQ [Oscillospiraceae bacterium]|nr:cobalamin biosynthesis protein CobQ [Oscillospiraceae bacterium]
MITLITGHYGSGKTTAAANLAALRAGTGSTALVDMDTVNPYFRAADLSAFLEEKGVKLIAPMYAGTNLDLPILNFDIAAISREYENVICDMGGDDAGAYPFGKFSEYVKNCGAGWEHLFTVNFCRPLTSSPEECAESIDEIVRASRMPVTAIINNTNLGSETTEEIIKDGLEKAKALEELTGISVTYSTFPAFLDVSFSEQLVKTEILIKNIWE